MLKKLKDNFSLFLLFSFLIRILIFGAGVGEAIALASLCALYGFLHFVESKKEIPINEVTKLQMLELAKELQTLNGKIEALKLGAAFRGPHGR